MFKNKKFLIISVLTAILLVFTVSNCFASSFDEEPFSGSLTDDVLNNINKFMVKNNFTDYIFFYGCSGYNANLLLFFNSAETGPLYEEYSTDPSYDYYYLRTSNDCHYATSFLTEFTSSSLPTLNNRTASSGETLCTSILGNPIQFFSSTVDIYDSNKVDLVFPLPPVVEAQGVVAPQLEGVQMTQVMTEVVGLLPLVIGFVVLVIGFRKALQTLSTILKNS